LTLPNYTQLPKLIEEFRSRGLEILAFPCPQFQPARVRKKKENVEKVRNVFDCKEDIHWFDSGHVNGKETREVYSYLKRELPGDKKLPDIEWNYSKFLIASDGKPYKRYNPFAEPLELRDDIEYLLKLKEKEDAENAAAAAEKKAKELMKEAKEVEKKAKEAEKKAAKLAKKEANARKKETKKIEVALTRAEERARIAEEQIKAAQEQIENANKRSLASSRALKSTEDGTNRT